MPSSSSALPLSAAVLLAVSTLPVLPVLPALPVLPVLPALPAPPVVVFAVLCGALRRLSSGVYLDRSERHVNSY
jgi:hypothetical protein